MNKIWLDRYPEGVAKEIDIDSAETLVDLIEGGCREFNSAVAFSNMDCELTYAYRSQGREVVESQFDMFKRYELNPEDLPMLKQHCDHSGIDFHSTPTGPDGLRDLLDLGVGVLKNGSDFLGNTE